ncbi:hypothetical protein RLK93_07945, partial [Streptococcus pneumoniae]|nr:hypothetical protein [Streptococcus pneumoniae]
LHTAASDAQCPFTGAGGQQPTSQTGGHQDSAITTSNKPGKTQNKDWWPNMLNLNILHQHDTKTNPLGIEFDYKAELE